MRVIQKKALLHDKGGSPIRAPGSVKTQFEHGANHILRTRETRLQLLEWGRSLALILLGLCAQKHPIRNLMLVQHGIVCVEG